MLLDPDAKLLADSSDAKHTGTSLRELPGIQESMGGEESAGVWRLGDDHFVVAVTPVVSGHQVVAILVLGLPLDDGMATTLRDVTGKDVLITSEQTVLGASWRGEPAPETSHEEFSGLRAALSNLAIRVGVTPRST